MEEVVFLMFAIALYFMPSFIVGKKRSTNAVYVINLFLGWTLVGWVIALAMAVTPSEGEIDNLKSREV